MHWLLAGCTFLPTDAFSTHSSLQIWFGCFPFATAWPKQFSFSIRMKPLSFSPKAPQLWMFGYKLQCELWSDVKQKSLLASIDFGFFLCVGCMHLIWVLSYSSQQPVSLSQTCSQHHSPIHGRCVFWIWNYWNALFSTQQCEETCSVRLSVQCALHALCSSQFTVQPNAN